MDPYIVPIYVRRTSLRYVSILFFRHLYIRKKKILVMVLDSSGQEAFQNFIFF